jgi:hypothetical protein
MGLRAAYSAPIYWLAVEAHSFPPLQRPRHTGILPSSLLWHCVISRHRPIIFSHKKRYPPRAFFPASNSSQGFPFVISTQYRMRHWCPSSKKPRNVPFFSLSPRSISVNRFFFFSRHLPLPRNSESTNPWVGQNPNVFPRKQSRSRKVPRNCQVAQLRDSCSCLSTPAPLVGLFL